MRRLTSSLCVAALLLVCHSPAALAIPVSGSTLDQFSFLEPGNAGTAYLTTPGEVFRRAQTFTVGIEGQLDRILVEFNRGVLDWDASIASQMRLLSVNNGIPDAILATSSARTITPYDTDTVSTAFGTFDFFDLGLNFNVGDVLAFEIIYDGAVQWYENTYAGGSDIIINPPYYYDWTAIPEIDTAFQTYMVASSSTAVPEPSTMSLLLAAGFAAIILQRRRRLRGESRPS
jgi:hypothetical protein